MESLETYKHLCSPGWLSVSQAVLISWSMPSMAESTGLTWESHWWRVEERIGYSEKDVTHIHLLTHIWAEPGASSSYGKLLCKSQLHSKYSLCLHNYSALHILSSPEEYPEVSCPLLSPGSHASEAAPVINLLTTHPHPHHGCAHSSAGTQPNTCDWSFLLCTIVLLTNPRVWVAPMISKETSNHKTITG